MTELRGPPAYISKARAARELDMAESTFDDMVKRGILPPPSDLSTGCVRWCWAEIESAILARKRGAAGKPASDPYIAGAQNVTQIPEGRRGAA